jgi:hypothetical protein
LNNTPDTSAAYGDLVYGGAGQDVLIANTVGDHLIDWTGNYNAYIVPFNPNGAPTVSRDLTPTLPQFLYALSASDGADPTRGGDPTRNGEPAGELGLVLQSDADWNNEHGGPAVPQGGNTARQTLASANFNDGTPQGFGPQVGSFDIVKGRYEITPDSTFGDAISLFNESSTVIPGYFEMQATINAIKPTAGSTANAYLIFDWQSNTNFKFAGINVSTNKLEIGHYDGSNWVVDATGNAQVKPSTDYVVMLTVNGNQATLVQGKFSVSFTYTTSVDALGIKHSLNYGLVGLGTRAGSQATIDDVVVQAPPAPITLDKTVDFGSTSPASGLFTGGATGQWTTTTDGRFVGTAVNATTPAINLIGYKVTPGSLAELTTTFRTSGQGGFVFDYQDPTYYKFVTLSADSKQLVIGHRAGNTTVIDRTFSTNVSTNTDYKLDVTLRGGLVNVSLNGSVVASYLYNEPATSGGFGLISMQGAASGQTSFDIVRFQTDDALYGGTPGSLTAAATSAAETSPVGLNVAADGLGSLAVPSYSGQLVDWNGTTAGTNNHPPSRIYNPGIAAFEFSSLGNDALFGVPVKMFNEATIKSDGQVEWDLSGVYAGAAEGASQSL